MAVGFPSLPNELIYRICRYKCRHCLYPESWLDSPFERSETGDLKALSLTCQRLRHVPQQVMFHDVHPSGSIVPLLRTLFERPDLADLVRSFSNDRCTRSPVIGATFRALFVDLAVRFRLDDDSTQFNMWMQKICADGFERELWLLELTVALLCKAIAVFITVPARRGETEFALGKLFKKSVTMSSVKRLFLSYHDYRDCKLDLGCLGNFLGMMPCLERLDVTFCGGTTQFLPLYELRSLNFAQSNMSAASLKRLVMSCPKLERFE